MKNFLKMVVGYLVIYIAIAVANGMGLAGETYSLASVEGLIIFGLVTLGGIVLTSTNSDKEK